MQPLLWLILSLAVGYSVIILTMFFLQSRMIYYPVKQLYASPSDIGLTYEEAKFEAEDDVTLHGWFVPADSPRLTVLFFHGNAGNISGRMETIRLLHQLNLNVFIFDYRGYGQSEGQPDEQGTYRDAAAAWNYLTKEKNIASKNILLMGRSLGGAVAAYLAARVNPAGVILEATFTSAADLGAELYPWLPVHWLIRYKYNTRKFLEQVEVPVLVAHSRDDEIIPYQHGEKLYKVAHQPKFFLEMVGSHGGGFLETGAKYRNEVQAFIKTLISNKISKT